MKSDLFIILEGEISRRHRLSDFELLMLQIYQMESAFHRRNEVFSGSMTFGVMECFFVYRLLKLYFVQVRKGSMDIRSGLENIITRISFQFCTFPGNPEEVKMESIDLFYAAR